jgi:hypothetical protein
LWGHTAVWTGSGSASDAVFSSDKMYMYEGKLTAPLHNPTATGYILPSGSTPAACSGGISWHVLSRPVNCASYVMGCSCVALRIQSRNAQAGVLDFDVVRNSSSTPSLWSGWQIELLTGPAAGFHGTISYSSANRYHVIPRLPPVQLDESSAFILSQGPRRSMPTAVLPDLMLVFGGRSADSLLSGDVYMLNTNATLRRAVSASSLLAVDTEEFSLSTHDWQGQHSITLDLRSTCPSQHSTGKATSRDPPSDAGHVSCSKRRMTVANTAPGRRSNP